MAKMSESEFRKRVYASIAPESGLKDHDDPFVERAISQKKRTIVEKFGPSYGFGQIDLSDVIQEAGDSRRFYRSLTPSGERLDPARSLTTDEIMSSQALFDRLQQWRDFLRTAGFGSVEVPFKGLAEAASWVERTAAANKEAFDQRFGESGVRALDRALFEVGNRLRSIGYQIELRRPSLGYIKPDGTVAHVLALSGPPNPYLWRLADRLSFLEAATLIPQPLLTAWVLTDMLPVMPSVSLERQTASLPLALLTPTWDVVETTAKGRSSYVPDLDTAADSHSDGEPGSSGTSGSVKQRRFVITVNHAGLVDRDLKRINGMVRSFFGRKHGKPISLGHWEVWQLVRDRGGPPAKTTPGQIKRFFEDICQEYNKSHPDKPFAGWRSAWKAYRDVRSRI